MALQQKIIYIKKRDVPNLAYIKKKEIKECVGK